MSDYSKGKIYKIECNITNDVYYGSTLNPLYKRISQHKSRRSCTAIEIIDRGNYNCKIIEEYPCNSRIELETRERWWIENNVCINKKIPTRTPKEWRENNLEHCKEVDREWRENNSEHCKEIHRAWRENNLEHCKEVHREWRENNSEHCKEYNKEYGKKHYKDNKEKIKEYRHQIISCKCGSKITRNGYSHHLQSKKHQAFILNHTDN